MAKRSGAARIGVLGAGGRMGPSIIARVLDTKDAVLAGAAACALGCGRGNRTLPRATMGHGWHIVATANQCGITNNAKRWRSTGPPGLVRAGRVRPLPGLRRPVGALTKSLRDLS